MLCLPLGLASAPALLKLHSLGKVSCIQLKDYKSKSMWPTADPEETLGLLTSAFNTAFITKIISELHWYQTSLETEAGIHTSS